jgi:hypothetical protein
VERVVLVARLKPETRDRAQELITHIEATEKVSSEFERVGVFLAGGEVIFFCEGSDARETVRNLLNDRCDRPGSALGYHSSMARCTPLGRRTTWSAADYQSLPRPQLAQGRTGLVRRPRPELDLLDA